MGILNGILGKRSNKKDMNDSAAEYIGDSIEADNYDEEGFEGEYVNSLGVTIYYIYDGDDTLITGYTDPGWEHVYTAEGDGLYCPYCKDEDIRYHDGEYCCISCDLTFTEEEIDELVCDDWYVD